MRKLAYFMSIVLLVSAVRVLAAPPSDKDVKSKPAVNKMCPISGRAIDGKSFIDYKGHRIGFCCPGCDDKFLAWDAKKKDAFVDAAMKHNADAMKPADAKEASGDPYTLTKCVVSDEELGTMGDAPIKVINGREVRVCCAHCFETIEKDTKKYFEKMDRQMAADQRPYYPLTTCIVSHEPLKHDGQDRAYEYVYKNRLFRLCCKDCVKKIEKDPAKYMAELDKAVRAKQGKAYKLTKCPVSGESLGTMGEPVEMVVANRLIKFCCSGCLKKFNADPAKYIAKVDTAMKN